MNAVDNVEVLDVEAESGDLAVGTWYIHIHGNVVSGTARQAYSLVSDQKAKKYVP